MERHCILCGIGGVLHKHHVFGGANRKISEKYNYVIDLCPFHHNLGGKECIHQDAELSLYFKKIYQRKFEQEEGTREEFIKIFGRSYL